MFRRIELLNDKKELICYYSLVPENNQINTAMVYLHGLMSDFSWFRLPPDLPNHIAVVYIQRQPKNHTHDFMEWFENYKLCLNDFCSQYNPAHVHLVANCFGTLPALLWITKKPETFTTLTLCNPIFRQKYNFSKKEILAILFNNLRHKKNYRRTYLKVRHFSRIPAVMNFIENADDTTFEFSDAFFMQVLKLRKWLKKNLIDIGIPVHTIFSYEDEVVDMTAHPSGFWKRVRPTKTSYFHTDHFIELQPQNREFWEEVTTFQRKYENKVKDSEEVKPVLVTGSTGFLGQHICKALSTSNYKVVALARDIDKAQAIFKGQEDIEIRKGDLNDTDSLEKALNNVDVIIHSAGIVSDWGEMKTFRKSNVEGTKNLLIIAHSKGLKQFVLVGSLGVLGDEDQDNLNEDSQLKYTTDYYSNSKIEQEFFVRKYCSHNRIPFTIVRPGFIYGEGDNNFFPKIISNLKKGKLKFIGPGSNHLNTVYVGNVATLVSRVTGNSSAFYQSYNLTDKNQIDVNRLVMDITEGLNLPIINKQVSLKTALAITYVFENLFRLLKIRKAPPFTRKKITFMARDRKINSEKAYKIIGEDYIPYPEGISLTLNHLINYAN